MKIFNLFFLFFISFVSVAQKIEVLSKTDRTTTPLNVPFTFTIEVQYKGQKPKNLEMPKLPVVEDFNVLNRWSGSQSSISIINGHVEKTQSIGYNYQLKAQKKGAFTIDSLDVEIQGKTYKTKPIVITVIETQNQPSAGSRRSMFQNRFNRNPIFDSLFNNSNVFSTRPVVKQDVQMQMNLDKKIVYEGEALKVDWVLLVSSGNINYEVNRSPKLKGFWKEAMELNPQGRFLGTSIVNEILYRKTLFDSMILFPLTSGRLNVDSYSLRVNFILGFGNRKSEIKTVPSKPIVVKPLPVDVKNVFSGAVGVFKVKAYLKETETKVNEPITYHIRFEGDGHPQFIKSPKIPFPSSFKTYPPVEKSKFNQAGKNFKSYEIILTPKVQGQIVIPAFQISTFDPNQEKYVYHQIPFFKINVLKGDQEIEKGLHFFKDESQVNQGEDALKPMQSMSWPFFLNSTFLIRFWWYFYICSAFLFILLACWPFRRHQKTVKEKLREGLREVDLLISQNKCKQASVRLMALVYLVLYQFDVKGVSTDWTELIKKLPPSFYEKYNLPLISLMRNLEKLSFAPKKLSDEEFLAKVKVLSQKTSDLLIQLLA